MQGRKMLLTLGGEGGINFKFFCSVHTYTRIVTHMVVHAIQSEIVAFRKISIYDTAGR